MDLWPAWWTLVAQLRPAFRRGRTFLWFAAALAGFSVRGDLRGVTSIVRALGLRASFYDRLLDFFHSPSVRLDALTECWTGLVLRVLGPFLLLVRGRPVLLADGIKAPKTGRKMPAVKCLHQESQNNSKPEFITGHSCQALALVVRAAASCFALPLACRIHEGIVTTNRDKRTLLDKLVALFFQIGRLPPAYLVADAYYAAAKIILPLLAAGHHFVTRVKSTATAFEPAPPPRKRGRGRPRRYGARVQLRDVFARSSRFRSAARPVYGETGVTLRIFSRDLLWRPVGRLVRFVWVEHPVRGRMILLCTDLELSPLDILRLYGVRFKIEVAFKQAVHTVGAYAYHFWMRAMTPLSRGGGNQHLHRKSAAYRRGVFRKLAAYHCHLQCGLIAQGLLHMLSVLHPRLVWRDFGSWIRTRRGGIPPSEAIVAAALRHTLPEFLADEAPNPLFVKFLRARIDADRAEGFRLVA